MSPFEAKCECVPRYLNITTNWILIVMRRGGLARNDLPHDLGLQPNEEDEEEEEQVDQEDYSREEDPFPGSGEKRRNSSPQKVMQSPALGPSSEGRKLELSPSKCLSPPAPPVEKAWNFNGRENELRKKLEILFYLEDEHTSKASSIYELLQKARHKGMKMNVTLHLSS
jgi:hypothetical protein